MIYATLYATCFVHFHTLENYLLVRRGKIWEKFARLEVIGAKVAKLFDR